MNYCTKCGNKLKKENKYCTKCGKVINEEPKTGKYILLLGIFLVLFSSFALGVLSWNNMNEILRISFFAFECVLFFILSFILKKTGSKINKLFFIIGMILIPYTLTLVPYYNLLPNYFLSGAGLYTYLAIIYFMTFIIYLLTNINFKSNFLGFLSITSLLISIISCLLIFNNDLRVVVLSINSFIFILSIISLIKKDNVSISIFISVSLILVIPFLLGSILSDNIFINNINNLISLLLYFISTYLKIHNKNNSAFIVIAPFTLVITSYTYIINLLSNYDNIIIYLIATISILLYFISILFNNKTFNTISLVVTYITLVLLIMISLSIDNNIALLVLSVISLLFNLSLLLIFKYKIINYFIPINIFIIILSLFKFVTSFKLIYIILTTVLLFLLVYIILKASNNKQSFTYLLSAFVLSIFSMHIIFYSDFEIVYLGTVLALGFIFALTIIFKENDAFRVMSYVTLNIAALELFSMINNGLYYSLLTISGITLIVSLMLMKTRNIDLKPYILYSEILVFILTLFNTMNYSIYILFINVFIYALSYISLIKYYNVKWYRIIYIMLGLLTLIRMINTIIEPVVIASIISICLILIILTIMYLLDIENNISLATISIIILYPYYNLVMYGIPELTELYLLPLLIYDIVFTEIIKFKNKNDKKLWTIIPISILSYFFIIMSGGVASIVFDLIISFIFIILGLYRKYNYLIYFGIIFIIVTIFIRLFTVLNSLAIVILLIIIGFILIGIALYNELKKKEK